MFNVQFINIQLRKKHRIHKSFYKGKIVREIRVIRGRLKKFI